MKQIFFFALALTLVVATSCKNESSETKANEAEVSTPVNNNQQVPPAIVPVNNPPASTVPVVNTNKPATTPTISVPVQTTTQVNKPVTPAGMNPAHGEPGHRCDISVGAPLNSKPAPASPTVTTSMSPSIQAPAPTTITTPTVISQAPATTVAPGMNPAHGQPNHRCDIAVGAPLNSPPGNNQPNISTVPVTTTPAVKKDN